MQAAGYLKGRPRALYVLDYGLFKVHANDRVIGICGYLISTDADEWVLVDTGFPKKYAVDTAAAAREDYLGAFGEVLVCGPQNMPCAQMGRVGVTPDKLCLHIVTHTHIDHIGHLGAFPELPILISKSERALPKPLYWGAVQPMDWPDQAYLEVAEDTSLGAGFEILMAPGHAPGQIAILLDLPLTGSILLTSDAISRPQEIEDRFVGSWDAPSAVKSAERLMRLAAARQAFVIYGHSPEQWESLRKAPAGYF
ncbi:MAG: MBL fold metallo-hydrolase [Pseudomonadota bacterium]